MEYNLTIDDLDNIIDGILDESLVESVDSDLLQTVLDELDENKSEYSDVVTDFLDKFDERSNLAIERKLTEQYSSRKTA